MAADARALLSNIYTSELGRAPDEGGINFYLSEMQKGKTPDQIRAEISASAEGKAFDARNPADVISALYKQELGRDPDAGGLKSYTNLLSSGTSAEDIRRMLNASDEGRTFDNATVSRAYMDQLGRAPDPGGLKTYLDLVQQGYSQEDLERVLNASEEGRAFDTSTINKAYEKTLGRTADASGRDYWLNQMSQNIGIDPNNINAYLEGGRSGTDVRRTTTTTPSTGTTTTGVPAAGGAVTNANISGGMPGSGVEQRISTGALPQRVMIGGSPITLGGGYAAYPYGTQALADQLSIPMLKLQETVSAGAMPAGLVAAPASTSPMSVTPPPSLTAKPGVTNPFMTAPAGAAPAAAPAPAPTGYTFSPISTPTTPFTTGVANPFANVNYPSPWFVNADTLNPYGAAPGGAGGVTVKPPAPVPMGESKTPTTTTTDEKTVP